jgi:hypothetical protein
MSISLPPETAAKAEQIPDFAGRLHRFIEHQYQVEQWRARRASRETRELVAEGLSMGRQLKDSGLSRDELFARLVALYDEIPVNTVTHE